MAFTLVSLVTLVSEWKDLPETVQRAFVAMAPRALDGDVERMQRSPARLASLSLVLDRWHGMARQAGDAALKQEIAELQAFVADVQASAPVRTTRTVPRAKDVLGELPDDEPPAPALSTYDLSLMRPADWPGAPASPPYARSSYERTLGKDKARRRQGLRGLRRPR